MKQFKGMFVMVGVLSLALFGAGGSLAQGLSGTNTGGPTPEYDLQIPADTTSEAKGGRGAGIIGGGRIGEPLPGKTVLSTSDFAVAADENGGTFLCSMAGPDCSGFLDLQLMMIEGRVEQGELEWINGHTARITAVGTVVLVTAATPPVATVIDGVPYVAEMRTGGPGRGTLILTIPDFEPLIADFFGTPYGATGGFVEMGHIKKGPVRK